MASIASAVGAVVALEHSLHCRSTFSLRCTETTPGEKNFDSNWHTKMKIVKIYVLIGITIMKFIYLEHFDSIFFPDSDVPLHFAFFWLPMTDLSATHFSCAETSNGKRQNRWWRCIQKPKWHELNEFPTR